MVYAGIDQSLTGSGITIYKDGIYKYYLIESNKEKSDSPSIEYTMRLMRIRDKIKGILGVNGVTHAGIEGMSFGSNGRSVFELGGLSHLLREMLILTGRKFIVAPPTVVKKYWVGKGNAPKDAMIEEAENRKLTIDIMKNYGTKKEPNMRYDDNVVDSFAICELAKDIFEGKLEDFRKQIEIYENI